jgi:phosphomannomutase
VIGGEGNGGVIQPLVHLARDGPAAAALVVQCLAERGASLDDVVARIPAFHMTKREIVSTEFDAAHVRAALERRFGPGQVDTTDGLKVTWDRSWVHIRKSGTEPIVRVIAEAPTRDQVESGVAAIIDALPADAAPARH